MEKGLTVFVETDTHEELPHLNGYSGKRCSFLCVFAIAETNFYHQDAQKDQIDLVICFGGDGTFLHAASLFDKAVPPIMRYKGRSQIFHPSYNPIFKF